MTDEVVNPLKTLHNALNSIAPHTIVSMIAQSLTKKPEPSPAPLPAKSVSEEEAKPWTKSADSFRVITEKESDPRLQAFRYQGQNLLGTTARSGVYNDEDRSFGLSFVGMGDVIDPRGEKKSVVTAAKSEEKPVDVPFMNERKSGQQYWQDEPKKKRATSFF